MPATPTTTASAQKTHGAVHLPEPWKTPAFQAATQPNTPKPTSQITANWRSFFVSGFQSTWMRLMRNCGLARRSVELELRQILVDVVLFRVGLFFLAEHVVAEHEDVHVRRHEAPIRILRRADDRLAADVEAR